MDPIRFDDLRRRAHNGEIQAMRQLARLSCRPNPWGYGRAHAYKYSLMGAFLGDEESNLHACEYFEGLPPFIETAVSEEIEDWIDEKIDAMESEEILDWSPELLKWMLSHTELN